MSSTQPPTLPSDRQASWQHDPTGRHQYRYFDGARWTNHVADRGQPTKDPYTLPPPGPAVPAALAPEPASAPAASQDPTVPIWARSASTTKSEAVSTEPERREVYGSGTGDFVGVLILCLLFPIVSLWYGPKLLFTGHTLRGLIVLAVTAVWSILLIQML
jgi:hypothetical protein